MNKLRKLGSKIICGTLAAIFALCGSGASVFADNEFSVSPMNQKIILEAGKEYCGTFTIASPGTNDKNFAYKLSVNPFYVDNDHSLIYENNGNYNQIVDWIDIKSPITGVIAPNNTAEVAFCIDAPNNAPAGGQYAAIKVTSDDNSSTNEGINLQTSYSIAHIICAEIAGTTIRQGEVTSADVPSFLLSGNIAGTSTIKNTGNVHSDATYKLQVFPLFSSEEIYTNEEEPETKTILPDRTLMNTTSWNETPAVGIFNVIYTAEFEGVETKVEKMVIVCPIWLLFIIIFVIFLIIFWLIMKSKNRKKSKR